MINVEPRPCEECGIVFLPKIHRDHKQAAARRFCSKRCSSLHGIKENPIRKRKGTKQKTNPIVLQGSCEKCNSCIIYKRTSNNRIVKRRFCDSCLYRIRTRNKEIGPRTKGELFSSRKNWQSARTAIRRHAYTIFAASNPILRCHVCGYDKHAEISHIKSVSDFTDNSTINEINKIDNLVALCPNHHWEFDNGFLILKAQG